MADPVSMDYGSAARVLRGMPPSNILTIRGKTSIRWRAVTTFARLART
ncbi:MULTISPECIES: hypothetical protein [unclassified Chelatococcus]|nr:MULTISPECIES: hypothetical protein [unclassified Chelatococcus]MBS7698705.1 hypothetical protein [Chelatococcus sp. YT9]MBX3554713.1 hypothetical protein [Chelatococcus sp.]